MKINKQKKEKKIRYIIERKDKYMYSVSKK